MEEQHTTETPTSENTNTNPPKRPKRPFIIILAVILAAGIAAGAYYLVRSVLSEPAPVEYGVEDHVELSEPPTKEEVQDALDHQGFGGEVTEFASGKITLKNENGETKTLNISDTTPVYDGPQSIESSLDKVEVGMVINVGYIESTQEVESVWLD